MDFYFAMEIRFKLSATPAAEYVISLSGTKVQRSRKPQRQEAQREARIQGEHDGLRLGHNPGLERRLADYTSNGFDSRPQRSPNRGSSSLTGSPDHSPPRQRNSRYSPGSISVPAYDGQS